MHVYTGIGSRTTPPEILALMTDLALAFAKQGFVLRSGAADGADSAFEAGAGDLKEIYLPWAGFNKNLSKLTQVSQQALDLAATVHPNWMALAPSVKKLHGRNMYQILGEHLNFPTEVVVCWTKDGCDSERTRTRESGGTASAIVLADRNKIPVFNLGKAASVDAFLNWLNKAQLQGFPVARLNRLVGKLQVSLF